MEASVLDLLERSQAGDEQAREELIERHRAFIARVASGYCRRPLDWRNDDELSISMLAFNEAVGSYDPSQGKGFLGHASLVIHHRLVDWFRRQPSSGVISLDAAAASEEYNQVPLDAGPAIELYHREEEAKDRADDLLRFDATLREYSTSLSELGQICPKHRDTRQSLQQVASRLAADSGLMDELLRKKQLPIRQLELRTGLSRKVLETGRKYVIAVALILWGNEFSHLKGFVQLGGKGGTGE